MDQCMLDVTEIDNINIGDEVVIFGYEDGVFNADYIANLLGTISYEILCMISRRVPRVYVQGGQIIAIEDYLNREKTV